MNRKLHNVLFCVHVILKHEVVLDLFVLLKKNLNASAYQDICHNTIQDFGAHCFLFQRDCTSDLMGLV